MKAACGLTVGQKGSGITAMQSAHSSLTLACRAGYFDAPAALACPYGQTAVQHLPAITIVVCAIDGLAALKV